MKTAAHIITSHKPNQINGRAHGYGDHAVETILETGGQVIEVRITRDGESQFGIHIHKDGKLTITDYAHMGYQTYVEQNVTFYPQRPWKSK